MALMSFREANQVLWRGARPAHDGTQVAVWKAADDGIATVYTVPDGQTLFLCTALLRSTSNVTGFVQLYILTDGAALWFDLGASKKVTALADVADHSTFWPPLEVPEKYYVEVSSSAAGLSAIGNIFGWVE